MTNPPPPWERISRAIGSLSRAVSGVEKSLGGPGFMSNRLRQQIEALKQATKEWRESGAK